MQQDKNYIENKLKQLENKQLPDLSQMDKHWEAMQQTLTATSIRVNKKGTGRTVLIAAGIVFLCSLFLLLRNHFSLNKTIAASQEKRSVVSVIIPVEKNEPQAIVVDTTVSPVTPIVKRILFHAVKEERREQSGANKFISSISNDTINVVYTNNKADLMADFYNRLQKPVQVFTIDAGKAGTITCLEGTGISIPASAFVDAGGNIISGKINILVEEFYKYADMVAANLSTTADGEQLVTGGMIRISATSNGRIIKLRNDKEINLTMPTTAYDPQMNLFTERDSLQQMFGENYKGDTTDAPSIRNRNINWQQRGRQNGFPVFDGMTNVINMQDLPTVRAGRRVVAIYRISENSPYSVAEAQQILSDKYGGGYDKVKVKKFRERKRFIFFGRKSDVQNATIGDSIRMTLDAALKFHYIEKKDSAFYAEKIKNDSTIYIMQMLVQNLYSSMAVKGRTNQSATILSHYMNQPVKNINIDTLKKLYDLYIKEVDKYSFTIKNMGWINCDRFYDYGHKIDFTISLPDSFKANNFETQLVFTGIRSVMPGEANGRNIRFRNIPAGMNVYLVGLGEQDGKVVSFMENLTTNNKVTAINNLEATTPEAFREKIAKLDMNN